MNKTLSTLLIFQTLAGICGLVWMLSVPTSIVLIVLWLFWDWSWLYVLYSVVAGAVAKWLLRGFRDNFERCRLEQWLISTHGYSKEQAYRVWLLAYGDGGGDGHNRVMSVYKQSKESLDKLNV